MSIERAIPHGFQYPNAEHQEQTAIAGMWLFLATEVLLFGGLILCWIYARHWNPSGFAAGARETVLWIGTLNTAILISSSFTYALALSFLRAGDERRLIQYLLLTLLLGFAFLALKFGLEWHEDFRTHLFPTDPQFKIGGVDGGGARLFFTFYFIGTALHGLHMTVGVALVIWIIWRARRGEFSRASAAPVHVVGLYWSFVDIVWLALYPLIYLVR